MTNPSFLQQVRSELGRRAMPSAYVERVVAELADHQSDIVSEQLDDGLTEEQAARNAASRLGDPVQVADVAARQFRSQNLVGRFPLLTFLLAPIPIVLLSWVVYFLVGLIGLKSLAAIAGNQAPITSWAVELVKIAAVIVPPAFAAALFCWLATRSGSGIRWLVASCILLAIVAAAFNTSLVMPVEPGTGRLEVGFGTNLNLFGLFVPLSVAAFFVYRLRSSRFTPSTAA